MFHIIFYANSRLLNITVFTRPLNNPYDDVLQDGVKGSASITVQWAGPPDVLELSEDGFIKYIVTTPDLDKYLGLYELKPVDKNGPFKPQNFTYHSQVYNLYYEPSDLENVFQTVVWNASWQTWQQDKDRVKQAIIRETSDESGQQFQLKVLQLIFNEWYDGMNGNIREQQVIKDITTDNSEEN